MNQERSHLMNSVSSSESFFKDQIKELQEGVEKQKYTRAVAGDNGFENSTTNMWVIDTSEQK